MAKKTIAIRAAHMPDVRIMESVWSMCGGEVKAADKGRTRLSD